MKRVLIHSTGYHSRLIFRRQKKNYIILGFLDQNKKIEGRKIFNKYKVYHTPKHKNIDYDKILIAGYSDKLIKEIKKKNDIDSKKILKLNKIDIIPKKKILAEREKELVRLIKSLVKIMNLNDYEYMFTHSSLLAILRKDNFSKYSDVDILILKKDFDKLYLDLKKKLSKYYVRKLQYKGSKKITISEKLNPFNLKREPGTIDIASLTAENNKYFYKKLNQKKISIPSYQFDNKIIYKYKKINFLIPFKIKKYMKLLYGNKWFKMPKDWSIK